VQNWSNLTTQHVLNQTYSYQSHISIAAVT